ncbi:hypothetical protein BTH42_05530 [Burkholderia sp. SRS-W-2-2016]|uniref:Csu type fimbrial protein n=1 Tax=Burkholderia sp. SRS-W-2-2016 TaxID=1926878 RepID=UPI00094B3713|nr:spore coat U domain-containing protein [Burkholderia sp. SRS-W-2-2016]OLL32687.1 hypothetical protein BTH42_05530 [Burkholderia sp. SRS-W-2-2016]
MKYWLFRCLIASLALFVGAPAWAGSQCGARPASTSFGTVSSLVVGSTAQQVETAGGIGCDTGSGFTLVGSNWIQVKVNSTSNNVLTNSATGEKIPFVIYSDPNHSQTLVTGTTYSYSGFTFIGGSPNITTFPLYVATVPGANVSAGTYTATISLQWYWLVCPNSQVVAVCYGAGWDKSTGVTDLCVGQSCMSGPTNWGSGQTGTITLTLVVSNDCTMSATNVNFGSQPLASSFSRQQGTVLVSCTKGSAYSVGMSDGNNSDGTYRRMKSSAGNYLNYQLYQSVAGSDVWGSSGSARRASSSADTNAGVYDGVTSQVYYFGAEVLKTQATPPAGTYTDNVVVDVQF